ncbi:hypothetical protein LDJ79_14845 [Vibrio tritonius]|uniref:Uncharacterized protein n=1 Tax=Vibrio tritonius TaxID=1435069 RepID=A0ABS7YNZ8_9VIBR|nr:hypothetical protein [Vibrio tritonius]MCA2017399.1 hypothetical protein [Vibrio tritonius]
MNIHTKFTIGTIDSILKHIGNDTCRFFSHSSFRLLPAEDKFNKYAGLEIHLGNGYSLVITSSTWQDNEHSVIGFDDEESVFRRLYLKNLGGDMFECDRENLCFFIDGVIAKLAEIDELIVY